MVRCWLDSWCGTEAVLVALHAWLDTWSGLGAVVVGMDRHGYELWLAKDRNGWRSTFLHRSHVIQPWVGQVLYWWPSIYHDDEQSGNSG